MADLTIYGSSGCQRCVLTARKAEAHGLSVDYIDVQAEPDAAAQLLAEGYREIPVVVAGEETWTGFLPDLLERFARRHVQP